ncbi:MAG: ABC transporter permease [Patescibacteria group bacterium]
MKLHRIKATLLQEFFITLHSYEVILDIFVFPGMSIVVFGFLSSYIAGSASSYVGHSLLMGMLLWQVIFIIQYSVSVGSLWNIWSRNLSNMFITPIRLDEYLISYSLSGTLKAFTVFFISAFLINIFFGYNIFQLGLLPLALYLLNLTFFAFSMGIIILGLIFKLGTRIQAFAWGLLPIVQPIAAALYPVHVLPIPIQIVSYMLPPTFIFESARATLEKGTINYAFIGISFIENIVYFILALLFFNYMFNKSKETGQFARNEGA